MDVPWPGSFAPIQSQTTNVYRQSAICQANTGPIQANSGNFQGTFPPSAASFQTNNFDVNRGGFQPNLGSFNTQGHPSALMEASVNQDIQPGGGGAIVLHPGARQQSALAGTLGSPTFGAGGSPTFLDNSGNPFQGNQILYQGSIISQV